MCLYHPDSWGRRETRAFDSEFSLRVTYNNLFMEELFLEAQKTSLDSILSSE